MAAISADSLALLLKFEMGNWLSAGENVSADILFFRKGLSGVRVSRVVSPLNQLQREFTLCCKPAVV